MFAKFDVFDVGITGIKTTKGSRKVRFKSIIDEVKNIPENTIAVEISEFHIDGEKGYYTNPFNIYIGEVHTISELISKEGKVYTDWKEEAESIKPLKKVVCYSNDKCQNIVYAYLYSSDIVVKSVDELEEVLAEISYSVLKIKEASFKIKKLSYKNND